MRIMRQGGRVAREKWLDHEYGREYLYIDDGQILEQFHNGFRPTVTVLVGRELMAEDWVHLR